MGKLIQSHEELDVYRMAFEVAMRIFDLSRQFPREETYSLTDQIRRSSRSVCGNLAEAWRKRRYRAAFVSKLSDAESEAAETQTWVRFAVACGYWPETVGVELASIYNNILGKLVRMIVNPDQWLLGGDKTAGG
jgi:four helix bundle protein